MTCDLRVFWSASVGRSTRDVSTLPWDACHLHGCHQPALVVGIGRQAHPPRDQPRRTYRPPKQSKTRAGVAVKAACTYNPRNNRPSTHPFSPLQHRGPREVCTTLWCLRFDCLRRDLFPHSRPLPIFASLTCPNQSLAGSVGSAASLASRIDSSRSPCDDKIKRAKDLFDNSMV